MISDFFVAPDGKLEIARLGNGPAGKFPAVQYKNVDAIRLATLANILTGLDYETAYERITAGALTDLRGKAPYVFRLDPGLTAAMAALNPSSAQAAAARWVETEEWQEDGTTSEDIPDFARMLLDLGRLASQAAAQQKRLHLWIDL